MKYFIILIAITFFVRADYLYNSVCVYNLNEAKKGYCYQYSEDSSSSCDKNSNLSDFLDGYELVDGNCVLSDSSKLGLSLENYNLNMALLGNFVGFTILLISLILIISI